MKIVIAYFVGAFFMIVAGWILAIMSGWNLPYEILRGGLFWMKANPWKDVIIAACLLALGILPFLRPRSQRTESTFLIPSRLGEVRMSEPAMKDIIVRSAQSLPGILRVQPSLRQREDGLEVLVYAQLNPEFIIPETTEQLQVKIREDLELYTGIKVVEVKVLVRSLEPARQLRVR
ncbi:alkaline shock response membrane anchor protein AmaP [Desulfitobacterium metallireducens]|uniref:alkaline shock response membrane anchor protein AmaP n=1 Tax=Desulfitobacterium metallireducens TaxID=142877 RepID=UPI001FA6CB7C|nr:alkaline shock response membrane anchor protein AmaP [Desulfitobacterium metallireducens]